MKKKIILPVITGLAVMVLSSSTAVVWNAGLANWTGSPVDGGPGSAGQCSSCHSGSTSAAPTLSVTASPVFGTGNKYMPGTTYTITITPSGSYPKYGFNCEIINSQSTTPASVLMFGTFGAAVSTNCQIFAAGQSYAGYPPCALHNAASASAFKFKWIAPASGTGYLYSNVLGSDGVDDQGGDKVSGVLSMTLTPASTSGIASHAENVHALAVFPNPATDNVRITYTLMERETVSVKLYSLNGELVADLLNETQEVGLQNANAHLPLGLANGLYMVKLNVNGEQSTQKLLIQN